MAGGIGLFDVFLIFAIRYSHDTFHFFGLDRNTLDIPLIGQQKEVDVLVVMHLFQREALGLLNDPYGLEILERCLDSKLFCEFSDCSLDWAFSGIDVSGSRSSEARILDFLERSLLEEELALGVVDPNVGRLMPVAMSMDVFFGGSLARRLSLFIQDIDDLVHSVSKIIKYFIF